MQTTQQTIQLGPQGQHIPALGIGTWSWGDGLFWSYGKDYGADQVHEAFQAAVAAGITFFDTAEIYGLGESERLLGRFAQETAQPVQIATKYFPLPWRWNAQSVADTLTASLERLQVSSVPLYQIHWPFDFLMGQSTLLNALADEVEKGRIGAIGVSNYSTEQTQRAHDLLAARGIPLAANQVRYSLLTRQIERNGVMQVARDLGVVILAYSPLAQGLLTGKYRSDGSVKAQGARQIDPRFNPQNLDKLKPVLNALEKIAALHDKTMAQVALNWLIMQGNVMPIPGAKNAEQARQNAGALGWSLAPNQMEQLSELTKHLD
jgi:aryl-alcohol dehydrogenase-like predicted oxidoreductase